mmetsp:Transcript_22739/g.86144  ORF Transcript_22739/g.86144 Transcript_22739/m.86144 type:complete len:312 (-) Transcript_22739:392-1327(-)
MPRPPSWSRLPGGRRRSTVACWTGCFLRRWSPAVRRSRACRTSSAGPGAAWTTWHPSRPLCATPTPASQPRSSTSPRRSGRPGSPSSGSSASRACSCPASCRARRWRWSGPSGPWRRPARRWSDARPASRRWLARGTCGRRTLWRTRPRCAPSCSRLSASRRSKRPCAQRPRCLAARSSSSRAGPETWTSCLPSWRSGVAWPATRWSSLPSTRCRGRRPASTPPRAPCWRRSPAWCATSKRRCRACRPSWQSCARFGPSSPTWRARTRRPRLVSPRRQPASRLGAPDWRRRRTRIRRTPSGRSSSTSSWSP